ncbi:hypothetical protein Y032_1110g3622 [Ancylostoma ceylanicum]|uniref:Uncharacterized protein n=1 Tax=Ancylostoma ceylanicum TaxID=53326 RepID=A0A016W6K0_9BILA|nr:hypothetical protein Y032_1110g3622 [Ancylostoma ceylanicum]
MTEQYPGVSSFSKAFRILKLSSLIGQRKKNPAFPPLLDQGGPVQSNFLHCLAKADPYSVDYATASPRRTCSLEFSSLLGQGKPVP